MEGLTKALGEAQHRGFIGRGDLDLHLEHALAFGEVLGWKPGRPARAELVTDLGSGGGLPGLVLAAAFPNSTFWLIEGSANRARFLETAVEACDLSERVTVFSERAEVVARRSDLRGRCTAVVARAFGMPAEVAECGAPFLRVGGQLVVSEPPEPDNTRWPAEGLGMVGLAMEGAVAAGGYGFVVLEQRSLCPDRFPRRTGVPRRRPLF